MLPFPFVTFRVATVTLGHTLSRCVTGRSPAEKTADRCFMASVGASRDLPGHHAGQPLACCPQVVFA